MSLNTAPALAWQSGNIDLTNIDTFVMSLTF